MRLAEIELRFRLALRKNEELEIKRVVRFLNWKIDFATLHGMFTVDLLANDLNYLREVILTEELAEEHKNVAVYESLAYLQKSVLPLLSNDSKLNAVYLDQLPALINTLTSICKSVNILLDLTFSLFMIATD